MFIEEAHVEPCQTSMMEFFFEKIVKISFEKEKKKNKQNFFCLRRII